MNRTIAVDFDGVIHRYSRGWFDGTIYDEPVPGALDGLRTLMQHYAVFIHTSRSPQDVAPWLVQRGFDVQVEYPGDPTQFWTERGALLVTRRKLPALAYLDDRAVQFTSWPLALAELLPADAAATTPPGSVDQVQVSAEDLRSLVQLARCHVENLWITPAEDLALIERIHAQLGGEK
ncbi:hypothetical protein B0I32_106282 [Nonomuraea fuscirosea]|uniref:Uncharacterized protein n=1 Tax=Nonomuraea fuscirosea TaxID=1291556 RepID=A0A2T0N2I2_9ACTN|nr:hypothetical protein [Nonomuraea fuscirosea]PRX66146.1 hypothetical protein B0I32_106282 [Nonomuraea fuscirosea]